MMDRGCLKPHLPLIQEKVLWLGKFMMAYVGQEIQVSNICFLSWPIHSPQGWVGGLAGGGGADSVEAKIHLRFKEI